MLLKFLSLDVLISCLVILKNAARNLVPHKAESVLFLIYPQSGNKCIIRYSIISFFQLSSMAITLNILS